MKGSPKAKLANKLAALQTKRGKWTQTKSKKAGKMNGVVKAMKGLGKTWGRKLTQTKSEKAGKKMNAVVKAMKASPNKAKLAKKVAALQTNWRKLTQTKSE